MFKLIKQEGNARRGELTTVHGTIQTPVFMNVGTSAAIKGGISSVDLADQLKCQVELCNTYHLHVRPGDDIIYKMGGLHKEKTGRMMMVPVEGSEKVIPADLVLIAAGFLGSQMDV